MRVGFRTGLIHDASRSDWNGTGPRPISWAAWYPAHPGAAESELAGGGPAATWFRMGAVAHDAPLAILDGPCPVVLASHGTGGTALAMGWLARRLAESGYVVLAPNHHGNTATEPYRAEGFLCWWERARDFSVLMDYLEADAAFSGRVDTKRAVMAGFSLGGHTALSLLGAVTEMKRFRAWADAGPLSRGPRNFPDLSDRFADLIANSAVFRASWARQSDDYQDERIRAALLLAPAPPVRALTDASLASVKGPVHMVTGGADVDAPPEAGAVWLAERLPDCTLDIVSPDAGHAVFLPEATEWGRRDAPDLCVDPPGVDRRAIHQAIARATERLFNPRLPTAS